MTFVEWKQYQDSPISEEQLNKWKQENAFKDGMAVITGRVWRGLHEGQYFNCIDCDNLKAIEEFCTKNDTIKSLQEMAQHFLIEQHKDNASKAHVYFYSTIPIVSKSSSVNTVGAWKIENNEVPAFEIKSKNNTISFCTPSVHKNGEHYEIIGTTEPIALGDKPATELMHHLDRIFKKYGLQYLDIANGNGKALTPMTDLFRADFVIVQNNNRHEALLRIMESLIRRMAGIWSLDRIKQECRVWNNEHCVPPLDEKEFEKQWRQATKYIILKIEEDKKASNDIKQLLEVVSATSVSGTTPSDNEEAAAYYDDDGNDEADEIDIKRSTPGAWLVLKKERAARNKERIHHIEVLTDELLKLKTFKTLDDTKEIRYYKDGAYHTGGENIIRSTLNKLGGYMVTTTIKREVIEQIIDRTLTPRSEFDKEPFFG